MDLHPHQAPRPRRSAADLPKKSAHLWTMKDSTARSVESGYVMKIPFGIHAVGPKKLG